MKKLSVLIFLFTASVVSWGYLYSPLLTETDYEFQRLDNKNGSAMSSGIHSENPWASYNQWKCFKTTDLKIDCAVYDESTLVPSILAETEYENFSFDLHVEDKLNCEETKNQWNNLIKGGSETCIFAAELPGVELSDNETKPHSLWYIRQIKGFSGYWEP